MIFRFKPITHWLNESYHAHPNLPQQLKSCLAGLAARPLRLNLRSYIHENSILGKNINLYY
jgi:hypothetical protein